MAQELNSTFYRLRMIPSKIIQRLRYWRYRCQGYDLNKSTQMERGLNLDRVYPQGIHIGADTIITSRVTILSHTLIPHVVTDSQGVTRTHYTGELSETFIGKSCVVGVGATIMAGVKVGDYSVVGAGAVVTKDVPDHCIVAGNPAKVIKEGIDYNALTL